jgi:hypothetical protein
MTTSLHAPLCPSCGEPMRFAQSTLALRGLHDLQSLVCRRCGVTLVDSNPNLGIGSASARPHDHLTQTGPRREPPSGLINQDMLPTGFGVEQLRLP